MLPTPSTSHVSFNTIYEPAEDSFLLLDTLSTASETRWLGNRLHSSSGATPLVVEVGIGSGVVIAFLAANSSVIFGRNVLAIGVDINQDACLASRWTADGAIAEQKKEKEVSVYLDSITADLGSVMRSGEVDVLVFNPPYVPTETLPGRLSNKSVNQDEFAWESHLLELSYAGGVNGMEITNRLLEGLPQLLSARGVAYVLFCARNKPEVVKGRIRAWSSDPEHKEWHAETVGRSGKTAGWENLEIVRIWKE